MNLGILIRSYRKSNKLKQEDLAKVLGISVPTLKKYEYDEGLPKKEVIERLTKIIGIDIGYALNNGLEEKNAIVQSIDNSTDYERVQTKYDLNEYQKFTELLHILGIRVHGCRNKITDELKYCMTIDGKDTLITAKDFEDMREDILIMGEMKLRRILERKQNK